MRIATKGGAIAQSNIKEASTWVPEWRNYWKEGETIHVFYPILKLSPEEAIATGMRYNIMTVSTYGYSINGKEMSAGRYFIPSTVPIINGRPDPSAPPDVLWVASRIMKVIHRAEEAYELRAVEADYADNNNMKVIEMKKVVEKYQNVKSPALSALKNPISTECIVVGMMEMRQRDETTKGYDTTLVPNLDPKSTNMVQQELSQTRIRKLLSIVNDSKYAIHEELEVLEVVYTFPASNNRKISGKTDPEGILKNESLLVKYPEMREEIINQIRRLPSSDEIMLARHRNWAPLTSMREINSVLSSYLRKQVKYLNNGMDDKDKLILANNFDLFETFGIKLVDEELKKEVDEIRAESAKKRSVDIPPTLDSLVRNEYEKDVTIATELNETVDDDAGSLAGLIIDGMVD